MDEHLGERLVLRVPIGAVSVSFNLMTMIASWIVIASLIVLALVLRRSLRQGIEEKPNRVQALLESVVGLLENQFGAGFGSREMARQLLPFVGTLFLFVLFMNWISVVPFVGGAQTEDLNVPLSLGIMVLVTSHIVALRAHGAKAYLRGRFKPFAFLFPLHVMGDLGRTTSHSFRLFGNLFGGGILIAVFSTALVPLLVPVALNLFFGLFAGLIQAFVFAMLAVIYINSTASE
jgi:F-type H+-transporting ATPase subunit a